LAYKPPPSFKFLYLNITHPSGFTPPVSILKPLKGLEDNLFGNLESFCVQDYPEYEIILALRGSDDPAYNVARKVKEKYPEKDISIVAEWCEDGLNPKVPGRTWRVQFGKGPPCRGLHPGTENKRDRQEGCPVEPHHQYMKEFIYACWDFEKIFLEAKRQDALTVACHPHNTSDSAFAALFDENEFLDISTPGITSMPYLSHARGFLPDA
jgi:glycosyltransferase involved in cell wall biosynthesis